MHLLLTRPDTGEPDALHVALADAGHRITSAPLLTVTPTGAKPSLDGAKGLIVTSRNALKAVAPFSEGALALPLYAVGPGTAALAGSLGFHNVIEGAGTGRELAALIAATVDPAAGTLVHLAGDTLAYDLKGALEAKEFTVRTEVVYRSAPASAFAPEVADTLRWGSLDGVVLMSPRTARVYGKLVADAALNTQAAGLGYFCLSEAVARELAVLGSVRTAVARLPNSQEMLALIACEASDSA
jgi:uroporphyrinogen-III synthase